MKKNYFFKFLLFIIPVSAFLLMASSGGRSDVRSGSPGDGGNSCASCHTGGSSGVTASITSNIPAAGYALNTNYTVNVTSTNSGTGGFQVVAENSSNTKVGTFIAGTGSRVSGDRITQSNSNSNSWSFTWKSPATPAGDVKFHGAIVIADGNGGNGSGDKTVVTSSASSSVLGISEAKRLDFETFPNPASNNVTIQLPSGSEKATVQFYDYVGRLALTHLMEENTNKIDVTGLASGVYLLKVVTTDKIGSQKFIKK